MIYDKHSMKMALRLRGGMPPRGWRRPPGYKWGDQRKRGKGARGAGPAPAAATPMEEVVEVDEGEGEEASEPQAGEYISSRLRRGAPALYAGADEGGEESGDDDGPPPLPDEDEGDEEEDEDLLPRPKVTSVSAQAQRARAKASRQVLSGDEGETGDPDMLQSGAEMENVEEMLTTYEISITLSKHKTNINPAWATILKKWMEAKSEIIAGSVSLERGGKQEHLHCQMILRIKAVNMSDAELKQLKDEIKTAVGVRRGDGSGAYCQVKEFGPGQTWQMMLGYMYIYKDQALPHFRNFSYNIDQHDLDIGIAEWRSARLSFEDNKIMISKGQLFARAYSYHVNYHPGVEMCFLELCTRMLNTKKYMLASTFLTNQGQLRRESCEAMWKLIQGKMLSMQDVDKLLFPAATHGHNTIAGTRYFDPPQASADNDDFESLAVDDGYLAEANPAGPTPPVTRDGLSSFTRNIMRRGELRRGADGSDAEESEEPEDAMASNEAIRPYSPRSPEESEHESDMEFIDDNEEADGSETFYRAIDNSAGPS